MDSIPKIIHYCWVGKKEKPQEVIETIADWTRKLEGYKIIEWNEDIPDAPHPAISPAARCRYGCVRLQNRQCGCPLPCSPAPEPAKRPRHTVLTTILYNSSYIHILIISIKNMQVQTVFLSEFIYMQSSIPQTTKYQPFTYYPISVVYLGYLSRIVR